MREDKAIVREYLREGGRTKHFKIYVENTNNKIGPMPKPMVAKLGLTFLLPFGPSNFVYSLNFLNEERSENCLINHSLTLSFLAMSGGGEDNGWGLPLVKSLGI